MHESHMAGHGFDQHPSGHITTQVTPIDPAPNTLQQTRFPILSMGQMLNCIPYPIDAQSTDLQTHPGPMDCFLRRHRVDRRVSP